MKYFKIFIMTAFIALVAFLAINLRLNSEDYKLKVINENINTKLKALKENDIELYLTTINNKDFYYYNEQKRWFVEMTKEGMENITLEITDINLIDKGKAVAIIHQKHYYKKQFDFTYPLRFVRIGGRWLDDGYDFSELSKDGYTIKYMSDENRLELFEEMIASAFINLECIFNLPPDDDFEIKLFTDRELLRKRTIPSIEWLFTGWGEPNESLKIFTGHENTEGYPGTIQHELMHHITIKICNNNLSDWFLEGLALYYGNGYFESQTSFALSNMDYDKVTLTIEQLDQMDLYEATDQSQVIGWYNATYLYIKFLEQKYGKDKIVEMLEYAGEKPFNDSTENNNFKADNIATTDEAINAVLNISVDQLSNEFLDWLIREKGNI